MSPRRARLRRGAATVALVALGATGGWASVPAAAADAPAGTVCTPTEGFVGCRLFVPPTTAGAKATFTVPANVDALDVRVWGEGGTGGPGASGGAGGFVRGTLDVTPGESLSVAVGGPRRTGDALGGAGGGSWANRGGNSSGIRTSDGKALVIAGGGGGGGSNVSTGQAGVAGGEAGQDASEGERGGKGAVKGVGGAGGGKGEAGADASAGGAGGDGEKTSRYGGGGGGAGYAGGGGGAGSADDDRLTGSGGGGSSYADPDRMSDVQLLVGERTKAPGKDDPFWAPSDNPIDSGVAEGGPNAPGGPGRVVLQWKGTVPAELSAVSGDDQTIDPGSESAPLAVTVRDKDGKPVEDASVTFAIEDPAGLGVVFDPSYETKKVAIATDAQGRAQTSPISTTSRQGEFTVRATSAGLTKVFTLRVKPLANEVKAVGGDGQRTEPGQPFPEALKAQVTDDGKPSAGAEVDFRIEASRFDGGPTFKGGAEGVRVTADAEGIATAPEIVAGEAPGTYTITAKVTGGAGATFTVEVAEKGDPSATPSPGASAGTGGTDGDGGTDGNGDGDGAGGGSGDGDSATGVLGGLADTGAGGIALLVTVAVALAAVGFAAVRLSPRLRTRFQGRR
ncbi:glycine-rich protein [Streptomyces sp. NPDC052013]|uniref:glycine-rich domain-containing protein n=1 Tax=Streptomyces sp. NPDC052013 TaxID=3365679 RepID=UPI0037D34B3D